MLKEHYLATALRPKPTRRAVVTTASFAVVAISLLCFWLFKSTYPFGLSHSCSKGIGLALRMYANDHEDWFPHGGQTPEESLSFACANGDPYAIRKILRGKNIEQSVVDAALAKNGVLSRESCGWHYVEGLRESDSPGIAYLWDKAAGLNHNGRFYKYVAREVVYINGSTELITKNNWPAFVNLQKSLLAEAAANRTTNDPPIRWSDEETLGPNVARPRSLK